MSDLTYSSYGFTDIGRVRAENQDAFYIDEKANIYIIADGMGGLQNGSLASRYVIEELPSLLKEKIKYLEEGDENNISVLLKKEVSDLSNALWQKLGENSGTTVVLALLKENNAFITHLGDSRAYLLKDSTLQRLTNDHNVANLLVENGSINPEDARVHPMRHMLTNYVGMKGGEKPEVRIISIEPGNRILLCTDGLTGMLPEKNIENILRVEQNPKLVIRKLIDEANKAGGHDNITALLIDIIGNK